MGTMDKNTQGQQGQQAQQGGKTTGNIGSPISNEAYNVITALQAKLEGLEAYRKYAKDGNTEIWSKLSQAEAQGVGVLVDELERIVKEGKLRSSGGSVGSS